MGVSESKIYRRGEKKEKAKLEAHGHLTILNTSNSKLSIVFNNSNTKSEVQFLSAIQDSSLNVNSYKIKQKPSYLVLIYNVIE